MPQTGTFSSEFSSILVFKFIINNSHRSRLPLGPLRQDLRSGKIEGGVCAQNRHLAPFGIIFSPFSFVKFAYGKQLKSDEFRCQEYAKRLTIY